MIQAPCQGCGDRRVGCHDPAACARWAAFLARRDAARAAAAVWEPGNRRNRGHGEVSIPLRRKI